MKPPTSGMLTSNTSVESCPNDMNLRHELLDKLVSCIRECSSSDYVALKRWR